MTQQFSEGDHVFYRGSQLPWGHAEVLVDGDGDRYVLVALDHCGTVCVDAVDLSPWGEVEQQVEAPVQSKKPNQSPTVTNADATEQAATANTTQSSLS